MKNQLASIELRVLLGELKQLEGARLEKVYDLQGASAAHPGKALAFQLSKSESKSFLVALAPSAVFLSAAKPQTEVSPGSFCSLLRHHLDNSRLLSVSQQGSERILELVFSSKNTLKVIIELFSKGNIILTDESGTIIGAAESQKWSDRTIRPGFKYSPPPASADFSTMDVEQFSGRLLPSEKDFVVKSLAADIGLGGPYAEEICSMAGVDKLKQPGKVSKPEAWKLFSSLQLLLSRKLEPIGVLDDKGAVIEAFPFPVSALDKVKTASFPSFSEAVAAISLRLLDSSAEAMRTSPSTRKITEMEFAIAQQKATIQGMHIAAAESTASAEAIYLHYADVKQVIDDYLKLRKTFTPEQLKEYFKSNKKIISIDEKTGTITLELPSQGQ